MLKRPVDQRGSCDDQGVSPGNDLISLFDRRIERQLVGFERAGIHLKNPERLTGLLQGAQVRDQSPDDHDVPALLHRKEFDRIDATGNSIPRLGAYVACECRESTHDRDPERLAHRAISKGVGDVSADRALPEPS